MEISGDNIISLNGLNVVNLIMGNLTIKGNHYLVNLVGLENLQYIGGDLVIGENYTLTTLTGLDNVTSISGGLVNLLILIIIWRA